MTEPLVSFIETATSHSVELVFGYHHLTMTDSRQDDFIRCHAIVCVQVSTLHSDSKSVAFFAEADFIAATIDTLATTCSVGVLSKLELVIITRFALLICVSKLVLRWKMYHIILTSYIKT